VRGYGASAGSGVLLRRPSAAHPCAACAIPPHCRVLPARRGCGFVQPAQPSSRRMGSRRLRTGSRTTAVVPSARGRCDWWWPAMRKVISYPAFAFATVFAERSHDLNVREGRRALGVWRKQARDGLHSLVGAMDGGAERCARPPGHGGPVRSQRFCSRRQSGAAALSETEALASGLCTKAPDSTPPIPHTHRNAEALSSIPYGPVQNGPFGYTAAFLYSPALPAPG